MNRQEFKLMLEKNIPCIEGRNVWIWGAGNTARLYQGGGGIVWINLKYVAIVTVIQSYGDRFCQVSRLYRRRK